jgi:aryl-alcohol dehydrogenase
MTTMEITAAVLRSYTGPFTIERVRLDRRLGAHDILVEIAGSGMCHSDLAVRESAGRSPVPAVLGHEGSGVVVATGTEVSRLEAGDHVVLSFDSCGDCPSCLGGTPSYCEIFAELNLFGRRTDDQGRLSDDHGAALAPRWFGQSSFADYAVVRAGNAVKVDPAIPLELLGPLGCGFQTGAGTVLTSLRPRPGDTFAVFGAGAVGLAAIMAAVACSATVIAVDRHPARLELAEQLGATSVAATSPDLPDQILALTGGGALCALDTTGVPKLINQAMRCLRPAGTLGVVARQRTALHLEPGTLERGRRIVHICEGDAVPRVLIPRLLDLWHRGMFPFDCLIRTYPLSAINDAERDSRAGRVVKPVLIPSR